MEGRVKVMDFGLAHLEERSQLTRTGTTMGTLSYSSPEHISGKLVDRRSEIFSLGVVFYELLTGQLPFKASNEAEIVFAIINNEPPKLSKLRDDVPELVEAVISRMLEKDPELRYPTCGDVINDLKGLRKEMETSTMGITGTLTQLSKARKSRRLMWAVTGVAATVLIIATGLVVLPGGPDLDRGKAVVGVFENINQDPEIEKFASLPVLWITQGLQSSCIVEAEQIQYALQLHDELQRETERSGRLENALSLLARGAGAGWVISGQYWQQGGDLFFQAEIIDATRGKNGTRLEGTEPIRGTPDAPDSLMITLRDQTMALLARHVTTDYELMLLGAPTVSIEAFNDYKAATEAFLRGQRIEALRLCYRALERDPDYVSALIIAGYATHNSGRFIECDSLVKVADQKRDVMTRFERLWLDDLKGWLYGDREASYRASREWVESSPLAYYEAGLNAGNANRPYEAIRYLSKIDFDLPWVHQWLGNWTVYAGERDAALEVSERLAQIEDTRFLKGAHTYWRACIAAHLGDLDEAVQMLNQAYREGYAFGWHQRYSIELAPLQGHPPFQTWLEPRG